MKRLVCIHNGYLIGEGMRGFHIFRAGNRGQTQTNLPVVPLVGNDEPVFYDDLAKQKRTSKRNTRFDDLDEAISYIERVLP